MEWKETFVNGKLVLPFHRPSLRQSASNPTDIRHLLTPRYEYRFIHLGYMQLCAKTCLEVNGRYAMFKTTSLMVAQVTACPEIFPMGIAVVWVNLDCQITGIGSE